METTISLQLPKIGDDIYVPTAWFMSHGADDRMGGLAKVKEVKPGISAGETVHYVRTEEFPHVAYNWEGSLAGEQEKLKKQFGERRARPDPDYSEEFNEP